MAKSPASKSPAPASPRCNPLALSSSPGSDAAPAAPPAGAVASVEEVATLLRIDRRNSYGLMAPSGPEGQRHVRGYGLYMEASRINHSCMPTACRFDSIDGCAPPPGDA